MLQNLEKRALEKSSSTNVPERGRKVEDPWLKKAEEYIGQIIIHKAESSLKQEDQLSLEEQALTVVKTNDLSQIKELIKSLKTPADIKEILGKAEERLLVLDGLKRIKASSLQRLLQNRK